MFLVLIGVGVIVFLLTYVMPTFVSVYGESAKTLPWATQTLLDLVAHAEAWTVPVLAMFIGGLAAIRGYYATPGGRMMIDHSLLHLPLIGPVSVKHHTVQLTRTLGTVLSGGTPLVDALQVARGAVSNHWVSRGLSEVVDEIRQGSTLAAALDRSGVLPKLATEMLSVGEETGSLDAMLRDVAEFYEADLDTRLSQLTTWIEPALLLIMGFLVGGIVIVMYLPVFQMAGTVGS
jgi:type IV pilus assembly protein PilC